MDKELASGGINPRLSRRQPFDVTGDDVEDTQPFVHVHIGVL